MTPMPTPRSPENAWVTGVRCTSRTITATTAAAAAAISAGARLWPDAMNTTTNSRPGATDSTTPRTPPTASAAENCSAVSARIPRRPPSSGGTTSSRASSGRSGSLTGTRPQLVARVEHGAPAVDQAHEALDLQAPARGDAGDLAPAQPDQVQRAAAVVELGLERGHAVSRAQRDRPDDARDARTRAVRQLVDGRAPDGPVRVGALLVGLDLGLGRDGLLQPFLEAHRVSVISGPRVRGSKSGAAGCSWSASAASRFGVPGPGSRSVSRSRGGRASVPRTTTMPAKTCSRAIAAAGSTAARPVPTPRTNHRGPSAPMNRAGR